MTASVTATRSSIKRVFGDVRFRIDGELAALCFAADGTAWSVEEPGVLRHWNGESGELLKRFDLSDMEVGWTFSPDCRLLASGSDSLTIWDVASGNLLSTLPQPSWITAICFSYDGKLLATGHDDAKVRLWDLATGAMKAEWAGHSDPVSALAFSRDGKKLASAAEDKTINLWDVGHNQRIGRLEGHTDRIQALAWHPTGNRLVSAGWDTTARVWDTATMEPVILLNGHGDVVSTAVFSPDGKILASADNNHVVWLWDFHAYKPLQLLHGHGGDIAAIAFRKDGKRLLSGGQDRRLLLWEVPSGQELLGLSARTCETARITISPDGKRLASATGAAPIRIFDTATGTIACEFTPVDSGQVIAWSPDGQRLAIGDSRGLVHLHNPKDGKLIRSIEGHHAGITALAFSPDGKTLASAGGTDGYVFFWSMDTFEALLLIPYSTDNGSAETIAYIPNSNLLAAGGVDFLSTGGSDGVTAFWDYAQREGAGMVSGGTTRIAVRPDGKQLAAVTLTESFCLWDLTNRELFKEIGHQGNVAAVAYSPNGQLLASAGDDHIIRLWRPDTGELVTEIETETSVKDLVFSPDGKYVYTANTDTTCYQITV